MSDNNDLRGKVDEAKRRLPLPQLMAGEGLGEHANTSAHFARSMTISTNPFRYSRARTAGGTTSVLPDAVRAMRSCS
jgi:hypothetical protein